MLSHGLVTGSLFKCGISTGVTCVCHVLSYFGTFVPDLVRPLFSGIFTVFGHSRVFTCSWSRRFVPVSVRSFSCARHFV